LIGEQTIAMSCQNGLGNEEILEEYLGKERVLSGKTYVGAVMTAPGHILVGRKGKLTVIGEMDGQMTPRVQQICKLFNRAGFQTEISDNIRSLIWYIPVVINMFRLTWVTNRQRWFCVTSYFFDNRSNM
jgi:2-dehydropantoate 2-reductase